MIASEYGWDFEQFKKLTLRRLQSCLEMIEIRNHNNYAKQAALKGIKLDFKHVKRKFKELSDEQKQMMIEVTRAAAQRKVQEKAERARKRNGQNK